LAAAVPDDEPVPLNTAYGVATRTADDACALAAWLNSRWLTALARLRADPARGGFRRFNAGVVRELPVPSADSAAWSALAARCRRALLAHAVGLGKSYRALAVALARREPFALAVPAVLAPQWRALLAQHNTAARIITHESMSTRDYRPPLSPAPYRLLVVDEAHRFRNPDTRRYRALAKLVVGARVLLVTATPVHNRLADLFHL